MKREIGTRVIALLGTKDGVVSSFGEGVYAGDFPLPPEAGGFNFGQTNPRIDLDNGKVVWGCESWWGSEDAVRAEFPPIDWRWQTVDIDEHRLAQSTEIKQTKENHEN